VLWVSIGLVSLALYFAHSMSLELRAADNAVAALEAEQAIDGAARYVSNILANVEYPGVLPDTNRYLYAGVQVGSATFWLIGRGDEQDLPTLPHFGLVDESSKLNLNGVTTNMLPFLPRITQELAASIIDWRDSDDTPSQSGAESDMYMRLNPPYRAKNANFETLEELRLVYGANLEILYGEDVNLNGVLDSNENDGMKTPPMDNQDGRLDPGLLEYFTVYSRQPTTVSNTTQRINVGAQNARQQLTTLLRNTLGTQRGNAVLARLGTATTFTSVLDLYARSRMTAEEFALIEDQLRNPSLTAQINVNTASEAVLACIPGIGYDLAQTLVAQRRVQPVPLLSAAWVKDVLEGTVLSQAGPFLTGKSYQVCADIAAVGHFGRGYKRVKFIFDTSDGTPRVIFRQDLTHMGWALGRDVLKAQQTLAKNNR
jgi:type II secretory pathway component PulK